MDESRPVRAVDHPKAGTGLRAWRARLTGPTARKGVWAIADQALVSGTNFATAFVLARFCTKEEFGAYVLAFSAMLFLNGFQAALITGPMMVLGAAREGNDFRRYVTALGAAQLAAGAALTGLAFAAAGVLFLLSAAEGLRGAFLGMATALFFVQAQEFVRRVFFTRLEPARAFVNDIVSRGLQLAALAALFLLSRRGPSGWLSGQNVFFAVACSALAGSAVGLWQVRGYLGRSLEGAREYLRENWEFGRWMLGVCWGNLILVRANNFIVAAFAGVAGAAMLEAPRLLLAPLHIVAMGGGNVLVPRAAEKYGKGGSRALLAFMVPAAVICTTVFVCYGLAVAIAPGYWLRILGGKYEGTETILLLWAATYVVAGLQVVPRAALLAVRRTDLLMYVLLGAGCLMVVLSVWLSSGCGATGAAAARLGGQIALTAFLWVLCAKRLGSRKEEVPGESEYSHPQ